ncbi:MAG TPA: FAD-binding oxidoreductase [Thermoplasmata archaeon]|nr:FAD-binding oxidoreductase [Thermoplasmata archaeon]
MPVVDLAPSRADVVVVGGGCMGASVAFHLARRGERIVLLESGHVASGATGHSGAIVRQHYESRLGIRLARRSLAFFQRFQDETGASCDFRTTGFLSGTRERDLPAFEKLLDLMKSEEVQVARLTPEEAQSLEPHLNVADYAAVVDDPNAGYADPIATASGFATAAARDGATILEGRPCRGVVLQGGRVTGVRIRGGRIAADRVLLAAGNWTPSLAKTAGVQLPVHFVRGQVAILRRPVGFDRAPRIHFDFYHNTYSRPEGEKDVLVGYMDTDPRKTVREHELKDDSVPGATVRDLRARLAKRFPDLARAQPRGGWAGVYDVTPDSFPILDAAGPEGLFVAVGFSGHGFKLCPEIGRLLAEYLAAGKRPPDLEPLRASRYGEGEPIREDAPFPARRGPRLP